MMNLFGHFSFRTGYFGTRRRDFAYRHGTSSSFLLAERVAYRSFCIKSVVPALVAAYCPRRFRYVIVRSWKTAMVIADAIPNL